MSPRVPEKSVHPRLQLGAPVRPLNFTVRRPGEAPVRIRLSGFDNVAVADAVPSGALCGIAVRRLALTDWGDNWFLLQLDEPFEYRGRLHHQVLIRSQLVNYELGRDPRTTVFMLLVTDLTVLDKPVHTSQDFEHVTWAIADTLPVS